MFSPSLQKYFTAIKDEQPRRKAYSIALCALIICFVGLAAGCTNKAVRASREQAAKITRDSTSVFNNPKPRSESEEKRVYLDASISMKGFVNAAQRSQFDKFVDTIGDVMPGCQLYKYGLSVAKTSGTDQSIGRRARFGLELHQPEFYDLTYNPDDLLIEQLVNEEHPALSVLITDGVYSEQQGATSPPVVQAIEKWIGKGHTFGILILKSRFNGPFYSEHDRRMLPKWDVAERPFYAFVFSPTVNAFEDLRERLARQFPPPQMGTILFSDDSVSCAPKLDERVKGLYAFSAPPQYPYYWQMLRSEVFDRQNPAQVRYEFACKVSPDYPVSELKFEVATEYYRWEKDAFKKAERTLPGFEAVPSTSSATPALVVAFPKDVSSDYGFYHLKLTPLQKSFRPDISELSTRDDQLQEFAGKTFRFLEFITSLADSHFKKRVAPKASPAIFVTIENH